MGKLGYTRQAAAIPCHRSNTAKTGYDKENYSNGNKTVYEPAKRNTTVVKILDDLLKDADPALSAEDGRQ